MPLLANMKHLIILFMSLLSFLFGCNSKKNAEKAAEQTPPTPEWPRFPATDNPAATVAPVVPEKGYYTKAFFIADDKQNVYVLGYRKIRQDLEEGEEPNPGEKDDANFKLYCLDMQGQMIHQLDLRIRTKLYFDASFGMLEHQLMLRIDDFFLVIDPQQWRIVEKIPVYDNQFFPTKQKIELLLPEEQDEAYQQKFNEMLQNAANGKWLDWPSSGEHLIFIDGPKRAAWTPISWEDDYLAGLKSRFTPVTVPSNTDTHDYKSGDNFHVSDGAASIREVEYLSGGTELDYPNYKSRSILQYEMIVNGKTVHFSTTDKKRHNLRIGYSDSIMLATADGSVWVKYEGVLYRCE